MSPPVDVLTGPASVAALAGTLAVIAIVCVGRRRLVSDIQVNRANSSELLQDETANSRRLRLLILLIVHVVFAAAFFLTFGSVFFMLSIAELHPLHVGTRPHVVSLIFLAFVFTVYKYIYRRIDTSTGSLDLVRAAIAIAIIGYYALQICDPTTDEVGLALLGTVTAAAAYLSYGVAAMASSAARDSIYGDDADGEP